MRAALGGFPGDNAGPERITLGFMVRRFSRKVRESRKQ